MQQKSKSFRLLTELYSFLSIYNRKNNNGYTVMFLSPYGVIFILTETGRSIRMTNLKFPSPYRESFILIYNTRMVNHIRCYSSVSVSLWSIIHSYLRITLCTLNLLFSSDFRLFTELYSFLPKRILRVNDDSIEFPSPCGVSFILID